MINLKSGATASTGGTVRASYWFRTKQSPGATVFWFRQRTHAASSATWSETAPGSTRDAPDFAAGGAQGLPGEFRLASIRSPSLYHL